MKSWKKAMQQARKRRKFESPHNSIVKVLQMLDKTTIFATKKRWWNSEAFGELFGHRHGGCDDLRPGLLRQQEGRGGLHPGLGALDHHVLGRGGRVRCHAEHVGKLSWGLGGLCHLDLLRWWRWMFSKSCVLGLFLKLFQTVFWEEA